jgi:hypothetical protein
VHVTVIPPQILGLSRPTELGDTVETYRRKKSPSGSKSQSFPVKKRPVKILPNHALCWSRLGWPLGKGSASTALPPKFGEFGRLAVRKAHSATVTRARVLGLSLPVLIHELKCGSSRVPHS